MLKYVFVIFFSTSCLAQNEEVLATFDSIYNHMRTQSVFRDNVDWEQLQPKVYELVKEADSIPDLKPGLVAVLEALNDQHGRVYYNNAILAYYRGPLKEHLKDYDSELYTQIQYVVDYPFKVAVIDDIGYVRIVGLPMGDNAKMANDIQTAICNQAARGAKDWIIDLRYNGGGNLNPMVEGVSAILMDEGLIGGAKGLTENETMLYKMEEADFYNGDYSIGLLENCEYEAPPKVAVLTSLYTASSGEALAAILKQRPKTRFFGSKTFGFTTATNWYPVNDSLFVTISTQHFMDREGNVYKDYITVDEELPFKPTNDLSKDAAIKRAVEWLHSKD